MAEWRKRSTKITTHTLILTAFKEEGWADFQRWVRDCGFCTGMLSRTHLHKLHAPDLGFTGHHESSHLMQVGSGREVVA